MINFIENFSKIKLPFLNEEIVCFDFGTSITRIALKDKGIVLRDSSCIGYNTKIKDFIFFGKEAEIIIGKVPPYIKIIKPIVNGVISDFDAQVSLIKNYFKNSVEIFYRKFLIKPPFSAIAVIPNIATEIEQKAVEEVLLKIGINQIYLIDKPIANALGIGVDVFSHQPTLIVDLGAGLIEIAIISGGGIVNCKTLKSAGDNMNKIIYNYLYLKYGVILGELTLEKIKIELLNFQDDNKSITIKGKSLETGLPKTVKIKTTDIKEALISNFNQIIDAIKEIIENAPPEIIDELLTKGVILTGGLSKIKGIEKFFSEELKIPVYSFEFHGDTTIYGLLKLTKNNDSLNKLRVKI